MIFFMQEKLTKKNPFLHIIGFRVAGKKDNKTFTVNFTEFFSQMFPL